MKLEIVFKDGRKETVDSVVSFNVIKEQTTNEECHLAFDWLHAKAKGKFFEVKPLEIDRSKFEIPLLDSEQEWTRQIINEAFVELDKNPDYYSSNFYTLIPEIKWKGVKLCSELKEYAYNLGGIMADWIEQALEWAQRIQNGESWKAVCNDVDTANCYRLIRWKTGYMRLVGNSQYDFKFYSATKVCDSDYDDYCRTEYTVPLVVFKTLTHTHF